MGLRFLLFLAVAGGANCKLSFPERLPKASDINKLLKMPAIQDGIPYELFDTNTEMLSQTDLWKKWTYMSQPGFIFNETLLNKMTEHEEASALNTVCLVDLLRVTADASSGQDYALRSKI